MSQGQNQSVNNILEHLSGLTSQTDFDLLTYSLLKSLNGLLKGARIQSVAVDQNDRLVSQFTYSHNRVEATTDHPSLDEELFNKLLDAHRSNLNESHDKSASYSVAIYRLVKERAISNYLIVVLPRKETRADTLLIRGVLEIYRNFSSLLIHSQTDELTGLANRKTFEASIGRVYNAQRSKVDPDQVEKRQSNPSDVFWMCAIDIDHFKLVNDNYGHLFGDEVLIRISQIMQTEFRADDLLFRFGGEEFIALVRAADREQVEVALERFRQAVATTQFARLDSLTVSMGVVRVDPKVFHMTLMDYADQALYYSKNNGRNQTTFFEDLLSQGLAKIETYDEGSVDLF